MEYIFKRLNEGEVFLEPGCSMEQQNQKNTG
jgi:hypothetical protein